MLRIFPSVDTPEAARSVANYAAYAALAYAGCAVCCRELPLMVGIHYGDAADVAGWVFVFAVVIGIWIGTSVLCARRLRAGKGLVITSFLAVLSGFALLCDLVSSAALSALIDGLAFYGLINGVRAVRASRRMSLRLA